MSPESDKAIYFFFAAAMAKAMYPNASFGTGRWDELCSMLPKSTVNPSLAKQIVKSWWKDYKETWQKCIYRLYDCEPAELERSLLAANCDPYVAQETSNEIPEWDRITSEADSRVCAVLKTFVSSRLQDYPTCEEIFLEVRDSLYAYFCGATNYISRQLDGDLARYKEALLSLNASSYLKLLSALNMLHVVGRYLANPTSQKEEVWFNLVSEGISDIYDQPDEYLRDWHESLEYLADGERGAFRRSFRTYDEIAPLLGLRPNDTVEMTSWPPIITECVRATMMLFNDPEWRASIDAKLRGNGIAV